MGIVFSMWSCRIAKVLSSLEMQLYYPAPFTRVPPEMGERAENSQQVLPRQLCPLRYDLLLPSPPPHSSWPLLAGVFVVFF